jgi:3-hydroxyisobutyrate dehydrogenase-like beta-hydroxyacid dehydrogenase
MGLASAAYLEAVAFGVRAGVDAETIWRALRGEAGWRAALAGVCDRILAGEGEEVGVKFGQLADFLLEARAKEFPLPLSEALHAFCDTGARRVVEVNRPSPSFWHELVTRSRPTGGG